MAEELRRVRELVIVPEDVRTWLHPLFDLRVGWARHCEEHGPDRLGNYPDYVFRVRPDLQIRVRGDYA